VVAIAALMLVPAGSAAPVTAASSGAPSVAPASLAHAPAAAAAVASEPLSGPAATQAHVLSELKANHIASKDAFLPNFGAPFTSQGSVITPLYQSSPAPMGLSDLGVTDVHGKNVGTIAYSRSIKAAVTLNAVDPIYVTSSAPDIFTMQLNTVLTGTDVLGNTSYSFWIQNVPVYTASTGTLSFEDNIWNFSSPAAALQASSIYSGDGFVVPGVFYYAIGPSFHVPTPFTVELYNNASVVNDRPTVFFNYTIESNGSSISGSYDQVEFNSSATPPTSPAPMPTFQINGKHANPTNFLLDDAEIMLGGPGGGSTTTLFNIAGSMGLWLLPNGSSTYKAPASAYDFGTDTGETSEGIAEYATPVGTAPEAILTSGPSILYPLWGVVGATRGAETITVDLTPSNAFVFANQGATFSESNAAWAPTPVSGPAVYTLAPGAYTFKFLLSDYAPVIRHVSTTTSLTVTLASDPSLGVYTPLWARSNAQLAAISSSGSGLVKHPYVLFNNQGNLDQLFGELNDYLFPVFPGVYLIDTSAYVSIDNAPSFQLTYLLTQSENNRVLSFGAPLSNELNFELDNASHVSIVNSADLSGWFYNAASFGDPAAIYLWDSSWDLVAGNTFYVESNGITAVNGGHNTIWGNVFYPTTVTAANPGAVLNAGFTDAFNEFESNDLIYNNAFLTPQTASTPPFNFYTGAPASWHDTWNVMDQPATDVRVVNGWQLSGNILGLAYEGGNDWSNYGTATNPYMHLYTNGGQITSGGDRLPLTTATIYLVWVSETGLPAGTTWSATVNGYTQSTTGTGIGFWWTNGAYTWSAGAVSGYSAHPASGAVVVNGGPAHVKITYS